jgi:hypothetical protein
MIQPPENSILRLAKVRPLPENLGVGKGPVFGDWKEVRLTKDVSRIWYSGCGSAEDLEALVVSQDGVYLGFLLASKHV